MGIDYQSGAIYIFLSFYRPQSRLPWQLFFIFAVKKMDTAASPSPPRLIWNHPMYVLLVLFGAVAVCGLLGRLLGEGIAGLWGSSLTELLSEGRTSWSATDRLALRLLNIAVHFFTFSLASLLTIRIFYPGHGGLYFRVRELPSARETGLSILLLLMAYPVAQAVYWLNKQLPLPHWLSRPEEGQRGIIEAILQMDNAGEFALAFVTVALIPAVGEELLFRGVVQQQLERWQRRPQLAIWLTALFFSAMHMQFEGFFARLLLGAVLGYLYHWRGNLWLPILGHLCFNGLQVVAKYLLPAAFAEAEGHAVEAPNGWIVITATVIFVLIAQKLADNRQQPTKVDE